MDEPCDCLGPGYCPRHKFTKVANQWQLCRESARYRRHWDLKAPHRTETPPAERHAPATPTTFKRVGLGDMVAAVARAIGFEPCGGCQERRTVLNRVTVPFPARFAPTAEADEPRETIWTDFEAPEGWGRPDPRWAVAVTTAPRKLSRLLRSLVSLGRAGWTDVRLFAEPGCRLPRMDGVTVHAQTKGPFQNWRYAIAALRDEKPDAEFFAVFQDDVRYAGNLKAFLERDLWFAGDVGFVSPYRSAGKMIEGRWTPSERYVDRRDGGRERCAPGNGLWGALTYVFPRASVDVLLADEALKSRRRMIDLGVPPVLAAAGRHAWYYRPSLAEHMEGPSSLGHEQGRGMNSGGEFPGEAFDCLSLLQGANAA